MGEMKLTKERLLEIKNAKCECCGCCGLIEYDSQGEGHFWLCGSMDEDHQNYIGDTIDNYSKIIDLALLSLESSHGKDVDHFAVRKLFEEKWNWQQGAVMLKESSDGREWKKVIAEFFFQEGFHARDGEVAELNSIIAALKSERPTKDDIAEVYIRDERLKTELLAANERIKELENKNV